jgi:HK97 family phage major capsid protein
MGGAFIEDLKPRVAVMTLGATVYTGLSKNVDIPKLTAGTSTAWVDENAAPADSAPTTGKVQLEYHQLSATIPYSRKMLVQGDPFVEDVIRSDMLREIAVAVDRAAIAGSGVAPVPLGILGTAYIGSVAMGATGGAITWSKVLAFLEAVEAANIEGEMSFLTNFSVKRALLETERATGTAKFILDDANIGKLAGHRIEFSGNVPNNLTKGAHTTPDLSAMLFGAWRNLVIGQFGGLDVIVDQFTGSAKGEVRLSVHSSWDFALRYPEAFAASVYIDTTP